jgi:predicted MPP superfamily phosphohydrolase
MKIIRYKRAVAAVLIALLILSSCGKKKKSDSFSFVFMTDIHLTYERNAVPGFKQAIAKVNELRPDFVITGGDLRPTGGVAPIAAMRKVSC